MTVNANAFPGHGGTPFNPNGIRLGSPSVTSRGMGEPEMDEIAGLVPGCSAVSTTPTSAPRSVPGSRALCRRFPLPYRVRPPA